MFNCKPLLEDKKKMFSFIYQENAVSVICVPVLDTLACVVYADEMTVLKMPTGLRRSILAIYVIIVHRLHNTELPDSVCVYFEF